MSAVTPRFHTGPGGGRWLKCFNPRPAARFKLICFPFAGGGANCYRGWDRYLPPYIELSAVLLPGRETRIKEPRVRDAANVCEAVVEALTDTSWKMPLVFFGHSMGSMLALETAWQLKRRYDWGPEVIFASGRKPPHVLFGEEYHKAPEEIFIREIKRLNGTPDVVLEDPEMRRLVLPMLRDDYAILETYRMPSGLKLDCPIVTCTGDRDPDATPEQMPAWAELTAGQCEHNVFPGNHFYVSHSECELAALIDRHLPGLG